MNRSHRLGVDISGYESISKVLYILISSIMLLLLVVLIVIACIGAARRKVRRVSPQTMIRTNS